MSTDWYLITILLITGMLLSVVFKKLTITAALTGGLIGFLVFAGSGFTGVAMMAAFFIMASAATVLNMKLKLDMGMAERDQGRRRASQVLANAGVAGIAGGLAVLFPPIKDVLQLMIAASFTAATADTLSSEMGTVYGRKFYNILTMKKDTRGLDGVVSLEGSLFGLAGSFLISIVYSAEQGWNHWLLWLTVCGTAGNIADSVLGATLERKGYLKNDGVNFINTLTGALTALLVYILTN